MPLMIFGLDGRLDSNLRHMNFVPIISGMTAVLCDGLVVVRKLISIQLYSTPYH